MTERTTCITVALLPQISLCVTKTPSPSGSVSSFHPARAFQTVSKRRTSVRPPGLMGHSANCSATTALRVDRSHAQNANSFRRLGQLAMWSVAQS